MNREPIRPALRQNGRGSRFKEGHMRNLIAVMIVTAFMLVAVSGCTTAVESGVVSAAATPAHGDKSAAPDEELVAAINEFGFDLLQETSAEGENTIVSPFSVATALSMTHAGARGMTAEEMAEVLHVSGMEPERLHKSWADLLASSLSEDAATLRIANSLWADEGAPFETEFLDVNRNNFGAEIRTLDLQAPGAADEVNSWVSEQTEELIPEIVDEFDNAAVMELVNAIYFLGDWELPFEAEATRDETFTLANGDEIDVPMMHAFESWQYADSIDYQAVRMAYEGGTHAAYVIVPRDASTWELLEDTDAAHLQVMRERMEEQDGSVTMPVFELEWGDDLAAPLEQMGMASAFGSAADFSGISRELAEFPGLNISHVQHKTYLRVDEEGTEAAAATSVGVGAMSVAPATEPFELRADKPFIFALMDEQSGTLLFLGVIADPR